MSNLVLVAEEGGAAVVVQEASRSFWSSKLDPPLTKAKTISKSVLTYLRRMKPGGVFCYFGEGIAGDVSSAQGQDVIALVSRKPWDL